MFLRLTNKNKDMRKNIFLNVLIGVLALTSCKDEVITPEVEIPVQPEEALTMLEEYNRNIAAFQMVAEGKVTVVEVAENGTLKFDNKAEAKFSFNDNADQDIPVFGIDENGYWQYMIHGETQELKDMSGNRAAALSGLGSGVFTPKVSISKDGYWQVSFNGTEWKKLSDVIAPSLEKKTAESYALFKSSSVEGKTMKVQSVVGGIEYAIQLPEDNMAEAWRRFIMNTDDNVLLDYSYAGYDHGESAPADGFAWGYDVVNVKEYMEKNGIKSARLALNKIMYERKMVRTCPEEPFQSVVNKDARVVIYFPEGEYVLQTGTEKKEGYSWKNNKNEVYYTFPEIYAGNFIIKGAGKDKTKIKMVCTKFDGTKEDIKDLPKDVYGSTMLSIKNTQSPYNTGHSKLYANVVENAKKGDFSVNVQLIPGMTLKSGDWVQLRLRSVDEDLLKDEMGPLYEWGKNYKSQIIGTNYGKGLSIFQQPGINSDNSNEDGNGVRITEFHQVKSVSSNKIVFYEPIMSDINVEHKDYGGWEIRGFNCFENVGVEDLTFVGNAISPYAHHGEDLGLDTDDIWVYDEGFKPLSFSRVVNSWVRNVGFESVSEAVTFGESANCSAYNIEITGVRGHSAVRAAGSSRVFIGGISDNSKDNDGKGDGQWHGSGVSKPSIGNVIYATNWGTNACFESHATQPRATLFDNCEGGLIRYHSGGADIEAPNHLRDLTIWNLNVTGTVDEKNDPWGTDFKWWASDNIWWKIYPPIVVGTHGQTVTFSKEEGQLTYEENTGSKVYPESLYEAQLKRRLGTLPAWIKTVK